MTINYLKRKAKEFNEKYFDGDIYGEYLIEFISWLEKNNGKK